MRPAKGETIGKLLTDNKLSSRTISYLEDFVKLCRMRNAAATAAGCKMRCDFDPKNIQEIEDLLCQKDIHNIMYGDIRYNTLFTILYNSKTLNCSCITKEHSSVVFNTIGKKILKIFHMMIASALKDCGITFWDSLKTYISPYYWWERASLKIRKVISFSLSCLILLVLSYKLLIFFIWWLSSDYLSNGHSVNVISNVLAVSVAISIWSCNKFAETIFQFISTIFGRLKYGKDYDMIMSLKDRPKQSKPYITK